MLFIFVKVFCNLSFGILAGYLTFHFRNFILRRVPTSAFLNILTFLPAAIAIAIANFAMLGLVALPLIWMFGFYNEQGALYGFLFIFSCMGTDSFMRRVELERQNLKLEIWRLFRRIF